MIPIPLGTRYYKNKSLPVSTQILRNLYAEFLDSDTKARVVLHQMPGSNIFKSFTSGPIRGSTKFNKVLYVVSGTTLYKVAEDGAETSLGTISGTGNVSMAANATQLIIVNGTSTGYVYNGSTLASQALTGPAYTVIELDGYFIFDYSGSENWFISGVDDGTSYDSTETGAANADSDNRVLAVKTSQGKVYVFGTKTVEPYYNSGNVDFPFTKIKEGVIRKGAASRWCICEIDENLIWLSDDRNVYRLSGLEVRKISDGSFAEAVKNLIITDAESFCLNWKDKTFYVLTFPTSDKTFLYDLTTNLWSTWESFLNGEYIRLYAHNHVFVYDKHLVGSHSNANLYELSDSVFTDNTNPIRWEFITPFVHQGGDYIDFPSMYIDLETGEAPLTGQGKDPVLTIETSSDGKNFSNQRQVIFGQTGDYNEQVWLHRNGSDYQRCWKVSWSDPVKTTIAGMYLDANQ